MCDLIYKVSSIYLYREGNIVNSFFTIDNYFDDKWIILYHKSLIRQTGGKYYNHRLPTDTISTDIDEVKSKVKRYGLTMIPMKDIFNLSLSTDINFFPFQSYQPFDIFFNETVAGINIQEFDIGAIWEKGQNTYSIYKLYDYFGSREISIRDNRINSIIE